MQPATPDKPTLSARTSLREGNDQATKRFEAHSPAGSNWQSAVGLVPELKTMAGLVSASIVVAALYFGRDIVMPLCFAFLLGFVLGPLVSWLARRGLPRPAAVCVVIVGTVGALALAGLFVAQQVRTLSAELPTYQSNIRSKLHDLSEKVRAPGAFDGVLRTLDAVKNEVEKDSPPAGASTGGEKVAQRVAPPQRVQVVETDPTPFRRLMTWFEAASGPLASAGISLVFVVLVLLDRLDLRDRLLRLWGGNLHQSTDAMHEAGTRISRYLLMQLVVNLSYAVPMAAGLWLIGVPGALLWGALAGLLRFVPYLGPMISAVFPIALAFAVDPGWSMLLWTIGLIVVLEVVSNNIVEPWLYGASTGLSAISLMVAATFWTAIWGPVGLIMSTPLTVCLLVVGRHLPRLKFLDVLLGSAPALDTPTRIYQRLLAGEVDDALDLAAESTDEGEATAFYETVGIPVLRMATLDHARVATAEHRHRVVNGMDALLDDLEERQPAGVSGPPAVACIGGKWEVDNLSARMLAHALEQAGLPVAYRPAGTLSADHVAGLELDGIRSLCVTYFSAEPEAHARAFCRRLRRRWPDVQIVLAFWNVPPVHNDDAAKALGASAIVGSVAEAVLRTAELSGVKLGDNFMEAAVPDDDSVRLAALRRSGALDPRVGELFNVASKRAADVFDVPMAVVSLIDEHMQTVRGAFGTLPASADGKVSAVVPEDLNVPRQLSMCGHVVVNARTLVVPDITRDLRFAGNPAWRERGLRFYAGAPLRDSEGHVLGTLCLLDARPRTLSKREVKLLETMAGELISQLEVEVANWGGFQPAPSVPDAAPSATVAQWLPGSA
jgi:predicted PurR-regulated permease PerM